LPYHAIEDYVKPEVFDFDNEAGLFGDFFGFAHFRAKGKWWLVVLFM